MVSKPVPLNLSGNSVVGSASERPDRGRFLFFQRGVIMSQKSNTKIIVEAALMVGVASVLSIYPKFKFLPYGGSITVCSMLPIVLLSYRRGVKWGLLGGFAFALIQTITGFTSSGMGFVPFIVELLFDYLVAFTVLGLGGIFKGKFNSPKKELVLGSLFGLLLRFVSHFISGYVVWGEYADWFFGEAGAFGQAVMNAVSGPALSALYSFIYNATYMVPEMIITAIVAALIAPYADYNL